MVPFFSLSGVDKGTSRKEKPLYLQLQIIGLSGEPCSPTVASFSPACGSLWCSTSFATCVVIHVCFSVAAVARVRRIRFYKGECTSRSQLHVSVGHMTVMATVTFFSDPLEAERTSTFSTSKIGFSTLPLAWPLSCVTACVCARVSVRVCEILRLNRKEVRGRDTPAHAHRASSSTERGVVCSGSYNTIIPWN